MDILEVLGEVAHILEHSKYGNKYVLKGGLSLMSAMYTVNMNQLFRNTTDLDFDYSSLESWEELVSEIEEILTAGSTHNLEYRIIARRGFAKNPTSDSLRFEASDGVDTYPFKIDMNIKINAASAKYVLPFLDIEVRAVSLYEMIRDKLTVLCSEKIYRRIKDVYDLYALSFLDAYDSSKLIEALNSTELGELSLDKDLAPLEHAFNRFIGINEKPVFNVMVDRVRTFVTPIIARSAGLSWNPANGEWNKIPASKIREINLF